MTSPARVLLVDDSADIRELYRRLLGRQQDLEYAGARENADDLEAAVRECRADIAVVDLWIPGRDAIEAIQSTAAACPGCRIIVFTGYDDQDTRDRVLLAGARALVSKNEEPFRLLTEIRRVVAMSPK